MADFDAVDERITELEIQHPASDEDCRIVFHLADGRIVSIPLSWSWRLEEATPEERQNYRVSPAGRTVRWPDVDEDLSVAGALRGAPASEPQEVRKEELSRDAWPPGRIRKLRDALGLTQEEFGERVGVRQATVSAWERGQSDPQRTSMYLLDRIAAEVYGSQESGGAAELGGEESEPSFATKEDAGTSPRPGSYEDVRSRTAGVAVDSRESG